MAMVHLKLNDLVPG